MLAKCPSGVFCPVACLISCDKHISLTCAIGVETSITHTLISSADSVLTVGFSVVCGPTITEHPHMLNRSVFDISRSVVQSDTHESHARSHSGKQAYHYLGAVRAHKPSIHARSDRSRTRIQPYLSARFTVSQSF